MNKKLIIKGTLFLIIAGLITRFIGFFYRIYLSNILGAKNLGIYQLIFPIYGICYTIYASGVQTGISKLVSSLNQTHNNTMKRYHILSPFFTGALLSACFSFTLSLLLYRYSYFISIYLLHEPKCSPLLRILSLVFPFCGLSACINGFYYAIKKTAFPSIAQLIEQIIRVSIVYLTTHYALIHNTSCEVAVIGLVIGEFCSCVFIIITLLLNKDFKSNFPLPKKKILYPIKGFLYFTIPLTLNKLIVNILGSAESILIPIMLMKYGLSNSRSLSIYGILTGMAMSFISFPSTITNSLSVLLLPTVSEADSAGNTQLITKAITKTLQYSLSIGIFSLTIFALFGNDIGNIVFHNQMAGSFISILAWLCPFIYITTTFSSILNGLGKTHITFRNSIIGVTIRLLSVIFYIPIVGIDGYLLGLLVSSILICILDYYSLKKCISFNLNMAQTIIKPAILSLTAGLILKLLYNYILSIFKSF